MRINSRLNHCEGNMFDSVEIKYALLGCLAFTNRHEKLREMLLYVLLCSASLDTQLDEGFSIYDIIDHMTGIIGVDYKKHNGYAPAEILGSLDKESKLVLFQYMNDLEKKRHFDPSRASGSNDGLSAGTFDGLSAGLPEAKRKLEEKLNCVYGDVKGMQIFQVDEYLKIVNEYLVFRLNQISVSIAKELYRGSTA